MKVAEAVECMTKGYLKRIIDSFTKDYPRYGADRYREIIRNNAGELADADRIATVLDREQIYSEQILHTYVLEALVNRPEYIATETELASEVEGLERAILDAADDPYSLQYEDDHAVDVLKEVLAVALEDERVSPDELSLIHRLREKLGIHEKSKRILLAQLDHFPRPGNEIHKPSEVSNALTDLQKLGVVFYCNRLEGGCCLIPDEIVPGVKQAVGIEITRKGWAKLLEHLTKDHLATILEEAGLPKSGLKEELQDRIIAAGLRPSESLDSLTTGDLYGILGSLPGAKVAGTKDDRIQRIIHYFDRLVVREVPPEAPAGELYYQYLVEIAHRDRENLLANEVIKKDREIDAAFEEGTRYLFSNKLGLELIELDGSDHPDGSFEIGHRGDVLMWDNKSKETVYTFPRSHVKQFKRYIRDSDRRVSCFLVIVPEVTEEAGKVAARLKVESRTDTDVALITAEDLKWLAKQWEESADEATFDPEVFNVTGIIDRPLLEERMGLFL